MIRFQLSFLRQTRCFSTSIPALTATPSRTRKRVKKAAIISAPSDIDKPPVEPLKDEILPVITGGAKQLTVDDLDPSKIDTDPNRMEKMLSAKLMREYCVSKGLQKYGTKKVLISRIRKYWNVDTFDHIGKKEFELSKKEMFFMQKGRIVEKISTLANVGISVDEKEGKLTVTGAPSAIKKAHELFGDFMDINTVQLDDNTHKQDLNRISQVCNVYFEQSSDDQLTVSYLDKESLEACKEMLKTTEDNQFHSLSLLVDNMPSTVNLAEFSDPHLRQKTHLNYYSLLRSSAVKPKINEELIEKFYESIPQTEKITIGARLGKLYFTSAEPQNTIDTANLLASNSALKPHILPGLSLRKFSRFTDRLSTAPPQYFTEIALKYRVLDNSDYFYRVTLRPNQTPVDANDKKFLISDFSVIGSKLVSEAYFSALSSLDFSIYAREMETIEGNEFEDKLLTTAGKFQSSLLLPLGRCELEGWQRSYKRVTQLDDESVQLIHSNQSLHSVDTADVFETLDARVIPLSDDNSDQSSLKERLVRVFQATMNLI